MSSRPPRLVTFRVLVDATFRRVVLGKVGLGNSVTSGGSSYFCFFLVRFLAGFLPFFCCCHRGEATLSASLNDMFRSVRIFFTKSFHFIFVLLMINKTKCLQQVGLHM